MEFRFTEEEEAFRQEIREFIAREWGTLTPEQLMDSGERMGEDGERLKEWRRTLGRHGYLAMAWPKEYGGREEDPVKQYIFTWEMSRAGAPFPVYISHITGPAIINHGNDQLKAEFLPKMAAGEIDLSFGYTEPGSGSDLASLQTRAVRDGDDYVVNGQKIFTSNAHINEYIWLAVRTDPDAPKHRGISILIVDTKQPGFSLTPLPIMSGGQTNITFYDNVRVPKYRMVGEENEGWRIISSSLDLDRLLGITYGHLDPILQRIGEYAKTTMRNGAPLIDDPLVRDRLAALDVELRALQLLSDRCIGLIVNQQPVISEASIVKVVGTELGHKIAAFGLELLGLYGPLTEDSKWAPLQGGLNKMYLGAILGANVGGTNEIQRNIIAGRGLGLPRG